MKLIYKKLFFILFVPVFIAAFTGCGSDDKDDLVQQEEDLYNRYVSPEVQTTLESLDVPVNRGINPPNIEGYYLLYPWCVKSTYTNDPYLGSKNFFDHYKSFFNQSGLKINLLSYEVGSYAVKHTGDGSFITGKGNKFSVFFEEINVVKRDGNTYTQTVLSVYSGEVVRGDNNLITGIKDLKYVLYMKDNDNDSKSIPNNTGRLFISSKNDGVILTVSKEDFDTAAAKFESVKSVSLKSEDAAVAAASIK